MSYLESMNILCFPTKGDTLPAFRYRRSSAGSSTAGMADLLAFYESEHMGVIPVWLQTKTRRGKQTPDQKHFQALVESKKHVYLVVTSIQAAKEFFA